MIHIVVAEVTVRLEYTAAFLFEKVLRCPYKLVAGEHDGLENAVHYGMGTSDNQGCIPASGLMSQRGIPDTLPEVRVVNGAPLIYSADGHNSFPFDIFSAVFFCLSRSEEYLISERDAHGRFSARSSIFKPFHGQPYLDRWIFDFGRWLVQQGKLASLPTPSRHWVNTLDIDIAYAYRGRGLFRNLGAVARDVLNGRMSRLRERVEVLAAAKKDPYDTYTVFKEAGRGAQSNICFVLCGKRKKYDINLNPRSRAMRGLIAQLSSWAEVGIHPSYAALDDEADTRSELQLLESATGSKVTQSRQHFLRFTHPRTFELLSSLEVQKEYSMGFADAVGFRSGTAYGHPYFDLRNDRVLPIEIQPLMAMDSALKHHMQCAPEDGLAVLKNLWKSMLETGGEMTTVFHNHSLADIEGWEGWQKVYLAFAESVRETR